MSADRSEDTTPKSPGPPPGTTRRWRVASYREQQTIPDQVVATSFQATEIRDWSLVLLSQNIAHRVAQRTDQSHVLLTSPENAERARRQIELFILENHRENDAQALPVLYLSAQPLWILSAPAFISVLAARPSLFYLRESGINDAERVLSGEWWRIFTAQTLHASSHHLASNAISGYLILSLLSARVHLARLATPLLLTAGIANAGVALTWQNDFRSLGFSTYIFSALGVLAAIEWKLMPPHTIGLFKRFEPLFSALFIAIMMGLGENSDILAHFYGFFCGIATGILFPKFSLTPHRDTPLIHTLGFLSFFALIALSWYLTAYFS